MFQDKQFHIKLFIVYSIILITITGLVSLPTYLYLKENMEQSINQESKLTAEGIMKQMDIYYNQYNQISKYFYLNQDQLGNTPVEYLELLSNSPINDDEFLKSHKSLRNSLALNSELYSDISRISVYSSSVFLSSKINEINPIISQDLNIKKTRENQGSISIYYQKSDPWNDRKLNPLFIFNRQLKLNNREVDFLEVQFDGTFIGNTSIIPRSTLSIYYDGEILYQMGPKLNREQKSYQQEIMKTTKNNISQMSNNNFFHYIQSSDTNIEMFYSVPKKELYSTINNFKLLMTIVVITIILLTTIVFYISAKILTNPIRNLKEVIDNINLEDRNFSLMENRNKSNEIESLNQSFRLMNRRLQNSLDKIVQFKTLQLQSKFNLLQAQVNPHFMFNMLGVITILAKREENLKVEKISRKLADFLKYTTSIGQNQTTLKKEIQFTKTYLDLMKSRYLNRLNFQFDIPSEIMDFSIPKLILQPIVENCISHGFNSSNKELSIQIKGSYCDENWKLIVSDNGNGFSSETIQRLQNDMKRYKLDGNKNENDNFISIGGMGILNTFYRLQLYYKEKAVFEVGNRLEGGAFVKLGGSTEPMLIIRGEEQDENTFD